jgi:hypothetical protein
VLKEVGRTVTRFMEAVRRRLRYIWLGLTLKPMSGADDAEGEGKPDDGDGKPDDKGGEGKPAEGDGEDKPFDRESEGDDDDARHWKSMSRRNENEAKRLKKENERLAKEAKERADKDKSEQEKAIEAARAEGEQKASKAAESSRRQDRLENAVIRSAAKGVKVTEGKGDDAKEVTVRFRDPEDALLHLQRAIRNGDVNEDDIFNSEGRVNDSEVQSALAELLSDKTYLRAGGEEGGKPSKPEPKGSGDGGKGGEGSDEKTLDNMTPEEHFNRIRKHGPQTGETVRSVGP